MAEIAARLVGTADLGSRNATAPDLQKVPCRSLPRTDDRSRSRGAQWSLGATMAVSNDKL